MDLPLRLERKERVPQPTGTTATVSAHTLQASSLLHMPPLSDHPVRYRAHVERMLARARKRSRQAQQIVEKWEARLSELDREGVAVRQPKLWQEEQPSGQTSEVSDGE